MICKKKITWKLTYHSIRTTFKLPDLWIMQQHIISAIKKAVHLVNFCLFCFACCFCFFFLSINYLHSSFLRSPLISYQFLSLNNWFMNGKIDWSNAPKTCFKKYSFKIYLMKTNTESIIFPLTFMEELQYVRHCFKFFI